MSEIAAGAEPVAVVAAAQTATRGFPNPVFELRPSLPGLYGLTFGIELALASPEWAMAALLQAGRSPEAIGASLAAARQFIAAHPLHGKETGT